MRQTICALMVLGVLAGCDSSDGSMKTPGDTTPPTVTLSASSTSVYSGEKVVLSASASDTKDGTITPTVTCNGGTLNSLTLTAPTVTADTTVQCTATAKDAAGNNGTASVTITVKATTATLGLIDGMPSATASGIAVLVAGDLPLDQASYQGTIGGQTITLTRSASNQLAFIVPDGLSGDQTLEVDVGGHHFSQTISVNATPTVADPKAVISGSLNQTIQAMNAQISKGTAVYSQSQIDLMTTQRNQLQTALSNIGTISANDLKKIATLLVASGLASESTAGSQSAQGWLSFGPGPCGQSLDKFVATNILVAKAIGLTVAGVVTGQGWLAALGFGIVLVSSAADSGLVSQVKSVLDVCFYEKAVRLVQSLIASSQSNYVRAMAAPAAIGFENGKAKSFQMVSTVAPGPSFASRITSGFATLAASAAKLPVVPDSLAAILPKLKTEFDEPVNPGYVSLGAVSRNDIIPTLASSGQNIVLKFTADQNAPNGNLAFTFNLNRPGVDPYPVSATLVVDKPEADDAALTVRQGTATSSSVTTRGADTLEVVANPSHGSVTLNNDGSFTYTPSGQYFGDDKFTYRAKNAQGYSNTATVSISVERQFEGAWQVTSVSKTTSESSPGLCPNETNNLSLTVSKISDTQYSSTYLDFQISLTMTSKDDPNGLSGSLSGTYDDGPGQTTESLSVHIPNSTSLNGSSTWSYAGPNGATCNGTTTITGHR